MHTVLWLHTVIAHSVLLQYDWLFEKMGRNPLMIVVVTTSFLVTGNSSQLLLATACLTMLCCYSEEREANSFTVRVGNKALKQLTR